jgi:galactose mutarotase-like enzyme
MQILENENLRIQINVLGAELRSIVLKNEELEYMWQGDPAFWSKTSPVLFPIVGGIKDNSYFYKNQKYSLPRHGFAREKMFEVEHSSKNEVGFLLKHDEATLENYPFEFEFRMTYILDNKILKIKYEVKNLNKNEMHFSLGAHPAFNVPLEKKYDYEDYSLEFDADFELNTYPLSNEGLVKAKPEKLHLENQKLNLKKELFYADALVFKDLKSDKITLKTDKSNHGLRMHFKRFPFYGIWATKDANFVCLEPWNGIADAENCNQNLIEKEGILKLESEKNFEAEWLLELW